MKKKEIANNPELFTEVRSLIEKSRQKVAITVNTEISMLYWHVGKRINREILQDKRGEYGKQIVASLSQYLTHAYGRGWSKRQLHYCIKFAEVFTKEKFVHTLCSQLSWSHIRQIIAIDDQLQRDFYIEMCRIEKWSVRTLQNRINSMLFERTAISKKPDETIKQELALLRDEEKFNPDLVFRDPYFLDFLGLSDKFSEKDLESAILVELQKFIIEFETDFAFLARQKRITIDYDDYYIDLLFYHRRLKSLVVIDLKLGKFKAEYKGQMELYLRWLEKYEMIKGENKPIGLILCASKNEEHVELLQLEKSNIKVAEYLTQLPDFKELQNKLHQSIQRAKQRLLIEEGKNE